MQSNHLLGRRLSQSSQCNHMVPHWGNEQEHQADKAKSDEATALSVAKPPPQRHGRVHQID